MSKILANEIANYGDNAPIDLKEGLNIPAGKPIQVAGSAGTSGQILSTTGTSVGWITPFDGDYNSLTNRPTIPPAQIQSDWNATSGLGVVLNKPVVPPLPSVTVASPAAQSTLTYNSANGEFTYTPPDLSGYTTEAWVGSQGYLTSYTETDTLSSVVARGNNTGGDIVVSDYLYLGGASNTSSYRLYNSGSDITIQNSQTGGRNISSAQSGFRVTGGLYGNTLLDVGGSVALYKDMGLSGSGLRLSTTSTGISVTGDIELGSGDLTTTGRLYYANQFPLLTDLQAVSASTYHGMFAHAHDTGHGYFAHAGGWTQLLDTGSSIGDLADVNLAVAPQSGQVLAYDGANWVATAASGGGGGIALTDLSVTTNAAGTAALTYNNVSGVFTYTPPDLTPYAQTANLSIANWDAAHGWGNHASEGYLVATSTDKTNWNTAYGWGDHAQAGYLTSYTETDPVFSASDAAAITSTDISNWNTAYGWGNYAPNGALNLSGTTPSLKINNSSGTGWAMFDYRLVGNVSYQLPALPSTSGDVLSCTTGGVMSWVTPASGGASVTISDTPPAASAGDLWWESDTGRLKIYYQDTDSTQWVDANPPLSPALSPDAPTTASSNGTAGDIRYDADYVYICIATNTWKRAALATW